MKRIIYALLLLSCLSKLQSQISIKTNIPDSLSTNSELIFEVTIAKGTLSNFAKYQIDLPEGAVAEEEESLGGTFSYENKRAKIVWVITPPDSVIRVKMKLITGPLTGRFEIHQKFNYIEDGNRKEVDAEVQRIKVYKQVKTERKMISGPKTVDSREVATGAQQNEEKKAQTVMSNTVKATPGQVSAPDNSAAMLQQASQLREDSKRAYQLGSKEKEEAEIDLKAAAEMLTKAESLKDEGDRNEQVNKAKLLKEKAEAHNATAEKILSLSRNLEHDAIDIESSLGITVSGTTTPNGERSETVNTGNTEEQGVLLHGYENTKIDRLSQKEIEELKQQASQFRKDAIDAAEVGKKEKEDAGKRLREAEETLKNAEYIKDKSERKSVIARNEALRTKAENDLQTAEKILILSKTLEENADEIERLVEYIQPVNPTPTAQPVVTEIKKESTAAVTETDKPLPVLLSDRSGSELVYSVQVGAFANKPDRSALKKIGKYTVVNEDNRFKVLVGAFSNREEAIKKRAELLSLGFDGFIVTYQKGKRLK